MVYTPLTIKAIKIAYKAHEGQYDQSGVPYILHPVHLAEQMTDETTTCIALLHDVLEDTALTLPDLEAEFPREITEAVQLLTLSSVTPDPMQLKHWRTKYAAAKEIIREYENIP